MFIDARSLPENEIIETDVCIVGAGAAGIILAHELIGQDFRVCLLESGGLEFDRETQSLYEGENVGLPYFPLGESRLRYFGGTTNHWTGACRPLDDIDFEVRDWIPYSGWPFDKSHLDPFYERAQHLCQLGPYTYDVESWENETLPRLPVNSERLSTKIFQFSPPTHFGDVYQDKITQASNITTYLYANVVDIETTDTGQTVNRLHVATLQGNRFSISARLFILATGGIENARLLLLSNNVQWAGLGNQNDLVGRFFMEHPYLFLGAFLPAESCPPMDLYTTDWAVEPYARSRDIVGALSFAEQVLRSEKLVNCAVYFPLRPRYKTFKEFSSPGVRSLIDILEAARRRSLADGLGGHLQNIFAGLDDITITLCRKVIHSFNPVQGLILRAFIEPAPNPDSRVTLSEKLDRLGKNQIRLNWMLSDIEKYSLNQLFEIFQQAIDQSKLGQIKMIVDLEKTIWPLSMTGAYHHMGTTRMHVDPKQGVVDENCQVHGISNLFIAGSSVFPTAGYANPTLTIVALAIRLADYIKKLLEM